MRSVYDHRIVQCTDVQDRGIEDFAENTESYVKASETLKHHLMSQNHWLGSRPEIFSDILPLKKLARLPEIIARVLGIEKRELSSLPRFHEIAEKSELSKKVMKLFTDFTQEDTECGWDGDLHVESKGYSMGKLRKDIKLIQVPYADSPCIEKSLETTESISGEEKTKAFSFGRILSLSSQEKYRTAKERKEPDSKGRYVAFVQNPWTRVARAALSLAEKNGIEDPVCWKEVVASLIRNPDGRNSPDLRPQIEWLLGSNGEILVDWVGRVECIEEDLSKLIDSDSIKLDDLDREITYELLLEIFDKESREWIRNQYAAEISIFGYDFPNKKKAQEPCYPLERHQIFENYNSWLSNSGLSPLLLRSEVEEHVSVDGVKSSSKYQGLKKWGWYLDDLAGWKNLLSSDYPIKALEIGAFDGVSANLMLDELFNNPDSKIHCIDSFLKDPTTPEVSKTTHEDFLKNLEIGQHSESILLYEGLSVEVLAWMIANEGYWESFDFIYIDGGHRSPCVITDAVMSWPLLKTGGVIAFDDYQWGSKQEPLQTPAPAINAFSYIFGDQLQLLRKGWRCLWRKV